MNKYLLILILLTAFSCKREITETFTNEPNIMTGEAYGSTFRIVYFSHGKNLDDGIQTVMEAFDKSVNTYTNSSFLSSFNKSEKGAYADSMLIELVDISRALNLKTKGYFDPSIAPLSEVWGFSSSGAGNSPSVEKVNTVMQYTGLEKIHISGDSLLKSNSKVQLNFNAITGYVNDKIGQYLDDKKVENYMIEVGGEVLAKGVKNDSTAWKVGIDKPSENAEREIFATLHLKNEALATSGNYRKFHLDETGRKIVHTINPKTGQPETTSLLSATVLAPTCAEADATATALMAMGLEKAVSYAESRKDLKFFLIWSDDSGAFQSRTFNGFQVNLVE